MISSEEGTRIFFFLEMQHGSEALVSFMHNPNLGAGHFPMLSMKRKNKKLETNLSQNNILKTIKIFGMCTN